MGAIIVLLAIVGFLVLFSYLQFPPPYADPKLVGIFNKAVLAVCVLLCLAWFVHARTIWMGTAADKWWLPLAILGSLAIEIGFLGLCLLLRNFWIFKPPRRHGSSWF